MNTQILKLLNKYDKIGPRYTSYPTAPEWKNDFDLKQWQGAIERSNQKGEDISLYFHIPFCRSACYYCACNIVISPSGALSEPYLTALHKEIQIVGKSIDSKRKVKQLHFGGGTPTYISEEQIKQLFEQINQNFQLDFASDSEFSIEIDPRVTSFEQLKLLRSLGFNRLSLGIQDFNEKVQIAVNRLQSFEMIAQMLDYCRELGFESINFDLIYGLPFQSVEGFKETLEKVIKLNPDRIALFNYAHLPSLRPFQKAHIQEQNLPSKESKIAIFLEALKTFGENNYEFIGMDHFAKKQDELCIARTKRTLHRNFQGYTTKAGLDLLGLGMTSISAINNIYVQNEKKLNRYIEYFENNEQGIPIEKGFELSQEDLLRRSLISKILCHGLVFFSEFEEEFKIDFQSYFAYELEQLKDLEKDGLISLSLDKLEVTYIGRIFLRNIAMLFDNYLQKGSQKLFSRTV